MMSNFSEPVKNLIEGNFIQRPQNIICIDNHTANLYTSYYFCHTI